MDFWIQISSWLSGVNFLPQKQLYRDLAINSVCQRRWKNTFTLLTMKHMERKSQLGKHFVGSLTSLMRLSHDFGRLSTWVVHVGPACIASWNSQAVFCMNGTLLDWGIYRLLTIAVGLSWGGHLSTKKKPGMYTDHKINCERIRAVMQWSRLAEFFFITERQDWKAEKQRRDHRDFDDSEVARVL